jgi:hypothetical protein
MLLVHTPKSSNQITVFIGCHVLIGCFLSGSKQSFIAVRFGKTENLFNFYLSFDSQDSVDLEVKVTDHGELTIRQQFTVQVTDVNEMPTKVELSNNQVLSFKTVSCTVN